MTGRTGDGRTWGLAISLRGVAALLLAMLLMAALAACGGGDAPDGSRDAAPATEPGATEEAEPEPAGSGASGRFGEPGHRHDGGGGFSERLRRDLVRAKRGQRQG